MLLSLTLSDFVLVERLGLEFQAGFSVLTGETGAGKSILVDALALVLGERAEAGVVRDGAQRAEIAAEFDLDGRTGLHAWLADNDLAGEDDTLLMRRVVEAGGRSRAFINGRPATAQQLKSAGEFLVDIHGQHAHYSLLKAGEQRRLLDAYAGTLELAGEVATLFQSWREASARREAAARDAGAADAEREQLGIEVSELDALGFTIEGWQQWQDEHRRLAHAAELLQGAQAAAGLLDDDEGVTLRLKEARARLHELAEIDTALAEPLAQLETVSDQLHDLARELNRYAEHIDLDADRRAEAEARIAAVQAAARKYRLRPEEIPERLAASRERLDALRGAADLAALAAAEAQAAKAYHRLAEKLSSQRRQAAKRLGEAVTAAMQRLAMKGGRMDVALQAGEPTAGGLEAVELQVSPHAGQAVSPLARTASGGELSRLGLALQTVLAGLSSVPVLIFDEVDVGIGGAVAEVVGRMLAEVGARRQVLCVTHLPQVAACATGHYQVSKATQAGRMVSQVARLDGEARVEELARMLGGVRITEATRAHAAEMLRG